MEWSCPRFLSPMPLPESAEYEELATFIDHHIDSCLQYFPLLTQVLLKRVGIKNTLDFITQYASKRVSCHYLESYFLSFNVAQTSVYEDLALMETEFIEVQSKLGFMSSIRKFICERMIESGVNNVHISNTLGVSYSTVRRMWQSTRDA